MHDEKPESENKLLLGFGIVLVLLLTISVAAIIGIQSINRQNDLLVEKTLAKYRICVGVAAQCNLGTTL